MLDKKEVKTYIVRLYCNHCSHEMESDGTVLCSYPPQYPYVCPNCGSELTANEKYPKIEYKEIEKEDKKIMKRILVKRPKDEVIVSIIPEKGTNTYHFINLTKGHICPCKLNSIEDAYKDLEKQIEIGKVISYQELN